MKKIAIMQPYFLPYLGYWQLIRSVDEFVIYDNIEFTKKGWFNRNRILYGDHDRLFSIPLKKDSDFLRVNQRYISNDSDKDINKILRIIEVTYKDAPYFESAYPLIKQCFLFSEKNLFNFIFNSIKLITAYIRINTKIIVSSSIDIDHSLKAEKKVLAICKWEQADVYVNAIGGQGLYNRAEFAESGIDLKFIQMGNIIYKQFDNDFVPHLSIIDVVMFNSPEETNKMLDNYELA